MHKDKVLALAKGFRGRGKNCVRVARERLEKSLQYAYRDRRTKKRDMRSLWIQRINAGSKEYGVKPAPPPPRLPPAPHTHHNPQSTPP